MNAWTSVVFWQIPLAVIVLPDATDGAGNNRPGIQQWLGRTSSVDCRPPRQDHVRCKWKSVNIICQSYNKNINRLVKLLYVNMSCKMHRCQRDTEWPRPWKIGLKTMLYMPGKVMKPNVWHTDFVCNSTLHFPKLWRMILNLKQIVRFTCCSFLGLPAALYIMFYVSM